VNVAMADIATTMRESLLAMAVSAGLAVMGSLMEESVTALCGPKGKHDPGRSAVRHGAEDGSVTLGGRRVRVRRPRVRATDGSGELPVPAYDLFSSTEPNCPPGATGPGLNRSAPPSRPRPARRRSRPSPGVSSRPPRPPWL
jgi:hypothetical protein